MAGIAFRGRARAWIASTVVVMFSHARFSVHTVDSPMIARLARRIRVSFTRRT
jgi:hypothetical protein